MDILCKGTAPLRFMVDVVHFTESKNWFWINFRHAVKHLSWSLLSEFSHGQWKEYESLQNFQAEADTFALWKHSQTHTSLPWL